MNDKKAKALEKLDACEAVTVCAVNDYFRNHPEAAGAERQEILDLLQRMFTTEKDYLHQNTNDYFQLYGS